MKEDKFLSGYMLHRLHVALLHTNTCNKEQAKKLIKDARPITSSLIGRVENLSPKNPLAPNVQFAFPILGIWLASNKALSLDTIQKLISSALDATLVKLFYSMYNFNNEKSSKKFLATMKKYSNWHENHPEDTNGWQYEFNDSLHSKGCYYSFKFCPIADFCIKNGYQEIAPILCSIDYATFKLCHGKLIREKTIAKGDNMCDFWIIGDKDNPNE